MSGRRLTPGPSLYRERTVHSSHEERCQLPAVATRSPHVHPRTGSRAPRRVLPPHTRDRPQGSIRKTDRGRVAKACTPAAKPPHHQQNQIGEHRHGEPTAANTARDLNLSQREPPQNATIDSTDTNRLQPMPFPNGHSSEINSKRDAFAFRRKETFPRDSDASAHTRRDDNSPRRSVKRDRFFTTRNVRD
jgi:hypothetical protein